MKNDLAFLAREAEKRIGKTLSTKTLHKIWGYVSGKEKPTAETLDKLALLVGYQSWDDFHEALHGEGDGSLNYEVDKEKKEI